MDLYSKIINAKNRQEAAVLVRAFAAQTAARSYCYSLAERISIIEEAERLAISLERDYSIDGDTLEPESQHPWKKWMYEAGFPMNRSSKKHLRKVKNVQC